MQGNMDCLIRYFWKSTRALWIKVRTHLFPVHFRLDYVKCLWACSRHDIVMNCSALLLIPHVCGHSHCRLVTPVREEGSMTIGYKDGVFLVHFLLLLLVCLFVRAQPQYWICCVADAGGRLPSVHQLSQIWNSRKPFSQKHSFGPGGFLFLRLFLLP